MVVRPNDPQDLNRYAYCRNNPVNFIDPTGYGWFSKFVGNVFGSIAALIGFHAVPIPGLNFMAASKAFDHYSQPQHYMPIVSAASAFVLSGFNPVAAISAYTTTAALDSGPGRRLTRFVGSEVFDDMLGMRPRTANIWSRIFLQVGGTLAVENVVKGFVGDPVVASAKYDANNSAHTGVTDHPKGYDAAGGRIPGGENVSGYNGFDLTDPKVKMIALTVKGQSNPTAVLGYGEFGPGLLHTGAVSSTFPGSTIKDLVFGHDFSTGYATFFGVCHTATNQTLLSSGISSTVFDLSPHWTTYATTLIYGNYGGQLTNYIYTGITADGDL